jgi:ubiquinone/menaquinone biosynthesis C-methylase UbiE
MFLKLSNWSWVGCLLILINSFNQANCCEDKDNSSYLLATGSAGQERLDRIEECYGHFSQSLLESLPPLPEDAKFLCIGFGTAAREIRMAQYWPNAHITAVDYSEANVELARKKVQELEITNIQFVHSDANDLPFKADSFHLVHCRLLLMHLRDPRSVLQAMVSTAKSGGVIICEELSSSSIFYKPYNRFYKQAHDLILAVEEKLRVDYDIGKKLSNLMTQVGLTSVKLNQQQPDRSNLNTKLQLYFALNESKPKLVLAGYDEKELNDLLAGLFEFANQENATMSMSDLFQSIGYKP